MATRPKLISKGAANISLADDIEAEVRVIDYVGSIVDGVAGRVGSGEEQLVRAPWFDYNVPFAQAAEIGVRRVTNDHSTVKVVVTTDGTTGEIRHFGYMAAEK